MKKIKFDSEEFTSTSIYKNFIKENTGRGNLHIRVSFAEQALPISNLKVTVSKEFEEYEVIFHESFTNISGLIGKISLPTPPKGSDDLVAPSTIIYKISTNYNNKDYIYNVKMYDGICVIQNINIVLDGGLNGN